MPSCLSCRWHLCFRCPCVKNKCRFDFPQFAQNGKDCPKYTPIKT